MQACADKPSDSKETIAGKGLHASDSTESLLMRFVREIEKKLQVRRSDSAVVSGYHLLYQHLVSDAAKVIPRDFSLNPHIISLRLLKF